MDDLRLPERYLLKASRAKDKNIEFSLTYSQYKKIMTKRFCGYSGIRFCSFIEGRPVDKFRQITIDRVDNNKGYIDGNVVAVCWGVNQMESVYEADKSPIDLNLIIKIMKNIEKYKKTSRRAR